MTETLRATQTLIQRVKRIQDAMQSAGIAPVDMRRAGQLEGSDLIPAMLGEKPLDTPDIELVEGPIAHRKIARRNETRFRWFADGSQKTMPVWRIGIVPIVVSIATAGILERDENGIVHLLPGSMAESVNWIVPQQTGNMEIRTFVDILESQGEDVHDPLDGEDNYHQLAGMYERVLYYANEKAGKQREHAERDVITYWQNTHRDQFPNSWMVIDGRLPVDDTNAIGLIKKPEGQHFQTAEDMLTLLSLPVGHRTTAYKTSDRARARVHWYQRMWPDSGLDARHSLIRIEASGDTNNSDDIDNIATWLMAERAPRATADARWATLLYPVHLLERMLKGRIAQITAGWPV